MPIDVLAKILGHTNTNMTRHYAKFSEQLIGREMQKIGEVFRASSTFVMCPASFLFSACFWVMVLFLRLLIPDWPGLFTGLRDFDRQGRNSLVNVIQFLAHIL